MVLRLKSFIKNNLNVFFRVSMNRLVCMYPLENVRNFFFSRHSFIPFVLRRNYHSFWLHRMVAITFISLWTLQTLVTCCRSPLYIDVYDPSPLHPSPCSSALGLARGEILHHVFVAVEDVASLLAAPARNSSKGKVLSNCGGPLCAAQWVYIRCCAVKNEKPNVILVLTAHPREEQVLILKGECNSLQYLFHLLVFYARDYLTDVMKVVIWFRC